MTVLTLLRLRLLYEMYTPYDIANHHHCAQNQPWIDVCTVFCYTVCIYVMHERKPTYFLYPHVVIPPPQFQADPRQGHWLVIGERCLWLKFIFLHPPRHICIATGQACSSRCAWDRAGGVSVLWWVGCMNTAHTSVHVWTHVNTYANTQPPTTHTQSPCASLLSLVPAE